MKTFKLRGKEGFQLLFDMDFGTFIMMKFVKKHDWGFEVLEASYYVDTDRFVIDDKSMIISNPVLEALSEFKNGLAAATAQTIA